MTRATPNGLRYPSRRVNDVSKLGKLGGFGSSTPNMGVSLWGAVRVEPSPLCLVPVFLRGVIIPDG
jgi:hypothetical protein